LACGKKAGWLRHLRGVSLQPSGVNNMDNRYSYDNPPAIGAIILTPSGREATVTSIGRFRSVNVKMVHCSLTLNLDANQCRKTPDTMVKEMQADKPAMEDFDARR
jgi:hypothetical protein